MNELTAENKMQQEWAITQMRMAESDYKGGRQVQRQMDLQFAKGLIAEEERERKKSQCDVLSIDAEGNLRMQTENLRIDAPERRVTNFAYPEIVILERLKNRDEKMYLFTCNLKNDLHFALFAREKCGSGTYVLKQMSAIGAEIFAPTLARKKQYAQQIFTLLIQNATKVQVLPERRGWYVDENGKLQFFQGRWTWEEAVKCAM